MSSQNVKRQWDSASYQVRNLTANTTLDHTYFEQVITNRGASGATVHTLPTGVAGYAGARFSYRGVANQNVTFSKPTGGTLIALGNAVANSIAFSTASQKVGAACDFVFDGTAWHATPLGNTTPTLA